MSDKRWYVTEVVGPLRGGDPAPLEPPKEATPEVFRWLADHAWLVAAYHLELRSSASGTVSEPQRGQDVDHGCQSLAG